MVSISCVVQCEQQGVEYGPLRAQDTRDGSQAARECAYEITYQSSSGQALAAVQKMHCIQDRSLYVL
jgi:hypothetical protein